MARVGRGLAASYCISSTLRWATVVSPGSGFIAFGVAAAVGVLFGWMVGTAMGAYAGVALGARLSAAIRAS